MMPPFFIWRSGTLDAFDSVEELIDRYPVNALGDEDQIVCDAEGRILMARRGSDCTTNLSFDEGEAPCPETLRSILLEYLERSGVPSDEILAMPLSELVVRAYPPPDPRLKNMKYRFMTYLGLCVFGIVLLVIAYFLGYYP